MTNQILAKKCCACNLEKQHSEFNASNSAKDKKQSRCRSCQSEYRKRWHRENRESELAKNHKYQKENKEAIRAQRKAYREQHNEEINARRRERRKENYKERLRVEREYRAKELEANPNVNRERNCRTRFGIDLDEKQRVIDMNGGLCPILNIPYKGQHDECCDHKHNVEEERGVIGALRGVISRIANTTLGVFEDNTQFMSKAIHLIALARSSQCHRSSLTSEPITIDNKCKETLESLYAAQEGRCCISGYEEKLYPAFDEYSGIFVGFVTTSIKQALGNIHYNADALLNMIKYIEVYEASYKAWSEGIDPIFDSAPKVISSELNPL